MGELARRDRSNPWDLLNAWCRDLSDHLLDCRRSLPLRLFHVDVRRLVRAVVEAELTSQLGRPGGVTH